MILGRCSSELWFLARSRPKQHKSLPPRVLPSILVRQEVEILSSDPEAGAIHNTEAVGLSDDDDDVDFEESSSMSRRKRTKASNGLEKIKRPSNSSPDSSDSRSSSRRVREAITLDGTLGAQEQDGERASISGAGSSPTGGASSTAAFSASSFDLQENVERRNAFQAGLKAALPDDEISSATTAGEGGSVGIDDKEGGAGAGGANSERPDTTSSSRGKGKGAASGRVKLTPMEQQVVDLKAKHPGVLLLVECGYRYRFFGEDALAAAKVRNTLSGVASISFCVYQSRGGRQRVVLRSNPDNGGRVGGNHSLTSVCPR